MMRTKQYACLFLLSLFLMSISYVGVYSREHNNLYKVSKNKKENKKEGSKKEEKKEPVNEKEFEPILIGTLLNNPSNFIDKKIKFRGKFSSFTTLALDYNPAMRNSKDYISICIFRPDSNIPLSELKLAYPVKDAKEDSVIKELEEGDLLEIYGKVFSAALDEPWVDIIVMKRIQAANKIKDSDANENLNKKEDKKLDSKKKK